MPYQPSNSAPDWVVILISELAAVLPYLRAERRVVRKRAPSKLRELRWKKILAVLTPDQPMTAKEIGGLTGLKIDGQLRADLSELKRQQKITRLAGEWGYVLRQETADAPAQTRDIP